MKILEEYKVPQIVREKQLESLEKMRPELEGYYQKRISQQLNTSFNNNYIQK